MKIEGHHTYRISKVGRPINYVSLVDALLFTPTFLGKEQPPPLASVTFVSWGNNDLSLMINNIVRRRHMP